MVKNTHQILTKYVSNYEIVDRESQKLDRKSTGRENEKALFDMWGLLSERKASGVGLSEKIGHHLREKSFHKFQTQGPANYN